jgi:hypothetical protein
MMHNNIFKGAIMSEAKLDRELLELAAKAAGYEPQGMELGLMYLLGVQDGWNPLTDDGDALRLAVKLDIDIAKTNDTATAEEGRYCTVTASNQEGFSAVEYELDDPYAATRRAIVRAAAAIGEAMSENNHRQEKR